MKCFECGGPIEVKRETVKDHQLGLSHVTLKNVPVEYCKKCGERSVVYPQIASLHRLLARNLILKKSRFVGDEIRFLRKYLGWSGSDFAKRIGVEAETVSRWENNKSPIGSTSDRALRLAVGYKQPVDDYALEDLLDSITSAKPRASRITVDVTSNGYEMVNSPLNSPPLK